MEKVTGPLTATTAKSPVFAGVAVREGQLCELEGIGGEGGEYIGIPCHVLQR